MKSWSEASRTVKYRYNEVVDKRKKAILSKSRAKKCEKQTAKDNMNLPENLDILLNVTNF